MADRTLLSGDEARAWGALHAGISGVCICPGAPSAEIAEFIQDRPSTRRQGLRRARSANEKTATEKTLQLSLAGKRASVCMKHVGLHFADGAFVRIPALPAPEKLRQAPETRSRIVPSEAEAIARTSAAP